MLATNFKDSGECAKAIIRSLWSTEVLQERIVRETQGKDKKILTPTKVEKGRNMFSQWLKLKGYRGNARTLELNRWNAHMSRTIEAALKSKKNGKKQNNQNKIKSLVIKKSVSPRTKKENKKEPKTSTESINEDEGADFAKAASEVLE